VDDPDALAPRRNHFSANEEDFSRGETRTVRLRTEPARKQISNTGFFKRWAFIVLMLFLFPIATRCQRLTPLAPKPDWSVLDQFQDTITHDEFVNLLNSVYAPQGADPWIMIEPEKAVIQENATDRFILRFAEDTASKKSFPHYWSIHSSNSTEQKPLNGLKIALDPGHLGGDWAKMEERWFQIGSAIPVAEGDMTLHVAQLLAPQLRELGAEVDFVRSNPGPITDQRPNELTKQAESSLQDHGISQPLATFSGPADPTKESAVPWEAERLFYRVAEIRERAKIVNEKLKPDFTICLHFNAEPWGDPAHPTLVDKNHLHLLINGCYSRNELGYDDVRYSMLLKLLGRTFDSELNLSEAVADSMRQATNLPPYLYATPNAKQIGNSGYVWARNLIANRLYECPVVYIEPYVMNNQEVFARVQAGEYEGRHNFGGVMKRNIYAEYADAVADGLANWARRNGGNR
jgi:N-acetylmuramoyl-L-alanine amidase